MHSQPRLKVTGLPPKAMDGSDLIDGSVSKTFTRVCVEQVRHPCADQSRCAHGFLTATKEAEYPAGAPLCGLALMTVPTRDGI